MYIIIAYFAKIGFEKALMQAIIIIMLLGGGVCVGDVRAKKEQQELAIQQEKIKIEAEEKARQEYLRKEAADKAKLEQFSKALRQENPTRKMSTSVTFERKVYYYNNDNGCRTGAQLINDNFYEKFPHLKPAEEPQFTKYDAFGIAANTDFEPFDIFDID